MALTGLLGVGTLQTDLSALTTTVAGKQDQLSTETLNAISNVESSLSALDSRIVDLEVKREEFGNITVAANASATQTQHGNTTITTRTVTQLFDGGSAAYSSAPIVLLSRLNHTSSSATNVTEISVANVGVASFDLVINDVGTSPAEVQVAFLSVGPGV